MWKWQIVFLLVCVLLISEKAILREFPYPLCAGQPLPECEKPKDKRKYSSRSKCSLAQSTSSITITSKWSKCDRSNATDRCLHPRRKVYIAQVQTTPRLHQYHREEQRRRLWSRTTSVPTNSHSVVVVAFCVSILYYFVELPEPVVINGWRGGQLHRRAVVISRLYMWVFVYFAAQLQSGSLWLGRPSRELIADKTASILSSPFRFFFFVAVGRVITTIFSHSTRAKTHSPTASTSQETQRYRHKRLASFFLYGVAHTFAHCFWLRTGIVCCFFFLIWDCVFVFVRSEWGFFLTCSNNFFVVAYFVWRFRTSIVRTVPSKTWPNSDDCGSWFVHKLSN